HRLAATLDVDGDAAPAGDESDDGVARHRSAALPVAHQYVIHAADADSAGGARPLRNAPEELGQGAGRPVRVAVDLLRRLQLLLRIELVQHVRRGELPVPYRADQIVGARMPHVVRSLEELVRLRDLGEVQIEALELPLQQVAADVDAALPLLPLDEVADLRLRPAGLDEAEPVLVRPGVRAGEDLDAVAVLQLVAQ